MRCDLVVDALRQALGSRPAESTIFHSDRGSQYSSASFRQTLARAGMRQSMSARANPYDNAWTESFIGTLKGEMLQNGCFENAADAAAKSSTTSKATTTITANTPPSTTKLLPNSKPTSTP
jgi:transposase InsO family protein